MQYILIPNYYFVQIFTNNLLVFCRSLMFTSLGKRGHFDYIPKLCIFSRSNGLCFPECFKTLGNISITVFCNFLISWQPIRSYFTAHAWTFYSCACQLVLRSHFVPLSYAIVNKRPWFNSRSNYFFQMDTEEKGTYFFFLKKTISFTLNDIFFYRTSELFCFLIFYQKL